MFARKTGSHHGAPSRIAHYLGQVAAIIATVGLIIFGGSMYSAFAATTSGTPITSSVAVTATIPSSTSFTVSPSMALSNSNPGATATGTVTWSATSTDTSGMAVSARAFALNGPGGYNISLSSWQYSDTASNASGTADGNYDTLYTATGIVSVPPATTTWSLPIPSLAPPGNYTGSLSYELIPS